LFGRGDYLYAKNILEPRDISHYLVALPMIGPERRLTPRTTWLADINFEPNNGGIVLNISEGGLCFHSIAPVQRNSTIRFWLSLHNHRIQAAGELAWMDETQKTGGLRFTALSAEAREQIRNWTSQPATPLAPDEASPPSLPPLHTFPAISVSRPDTNTAPGGSAPLAVVSPEPKGSTPWSGFSGGLAIGLLVSALVTAPFLFHSYRRQFGESIIQFGERVAAKPQARTQTASPAAQTVLPLRAVSPPLAPIPFPQPGTLLPQTLANPAKPQQAKLEPAGPATATPSAAGGPAPKAPATAGAAAISSTPPTISFPTIAVAPNSNLIPGKLGPVPPLEPANHPSGHVEDSGKENAGSTSEMYFEVGRFKDELGANNATHKLAQLGFYATVIQRGHLWTNSYYVLVGPYGDDREAKAAHKSLMSRGFKPQAFERGSRDFRLSYALTLNGMRMPVGDCVIKWESYSSDVIVQFVQSKNIVATVDGKWVKRGVRYERGAFVYTKNRDGSRNLVEIRFAGMSQALVFGKSS
jgi:hypothetical protein